MDQKNNPNKIILLLFPPFLNKFDFQSREKIKFLSLESIKKISLSEKNTGSVEKHISADYSQEIREVIAKENQPKFVLINYPRNEKQFSLLSEELTKIGRKIDNIILLNVDNYELISNIQNEYLICPHCEKIYKKNEAIKENQIFICPADNNYQFSPAEVSKFNEYIINYYLENSINLIEKYLAINKLSSTNITQLTIQNKEEIFSGEIQKKVLRIIIDNI